MQRYLFAISRQSVIGADYSEKTYKTEQGAMRAAMRAVRAGRYRRGVFITVGVCDYPDRYVVPLRKRYWSGGTLADRWIGYPTFTPPVT